MWLLYGYCMVIVWCGWGKSCILATYEEAKYLQRGEVFIERQSISKAEQRAGLG